MSELSLHQRILNAAASQEVENVKARHTYWHGRADATSEWDGIWCMDENTSWAHAFGRMRGPDQVWWGSVADYDKLCFENLLEIREKYPEVTGKDPRPLMEASVHTLVTDVIEVAEDGRSARGSFITPGVIHSRLTEEEKPYCHILWERYGSDFVLVDGEWKYLHEQVCPDIMAMLDFVDWAHGEYMRMTAPEVKAPPPPTLGAPPVTDPGPLHMPYSLLSKPQDSVPWPEPYKTLNNENTYTSLCVKKDYCEL